MSARRRPSAGSTVRRLPARGPGSLAASSLPTRRPPTCGRAALALAGLNNLLQGPHFTTGDLAGIAHEFDAQERQLMTEAGVTDATFLSQESGNVDASGNFSIQVLSAALGRLTGLELEDSRRPENKNAMQRPDSQKGFVLNRHSHWYCLRKLDNQWWSCNSMATAPEKITSSGNFSGLATTLRDLTYGGRTTFPPPASRLLPLLFISYCVPPSSSRYDNWTVFMVKGDTWPPPAPRNTGAPASNWVDPANPPPDPNGSAYGYDGGGSSGGGGPVRKKEEPKFQAFTGSGQTLGGGSSAPGASVAGGGGRYHSPLTTRLLPLTSYHSSRAAHLPPLSSHRSPFTAHLSSLTSHHSPLTTHHSPLTARTSSSRWPSPSPRG